MYEPRCLVFSSENDQGCLFWRSQIWCLFNVASWDAAEDKVWWRRESKQMLVDEAPVLLGWGKLSHWHSHFNQSSNSAAEQPGFITHWIQFSSHKTLWSRGTFGALLRTNFRGAAASPADTSLQQPVDTGGVSLFLLWVSKHPWKSRRSAGSPGSWGSCVESCPEKTQTQRLYTPGPSPPHNWMSWCIAVGWDTGGECSPPT